MEQIYVKVPEYPYDNFKIELQRDGVGALWRGECKIAEVSRGWEGWTINGTTSYGALSNEDITKAIDKAIAEGKLTLTRVPELPE